ncbi:MAG TPA: HXXEE domain-containing protein [Rhodothermia bacterium]|nr:HXXEE domain-containing protein [Rhodothermia bacterium]
MKTQSATGLRRAWLLLSVVVGLHVADEASHFFLSWYNPVAASIQAELGGIPFPPVFSFRVWLGGLILLVLLCISFTPLLDPRRSWTLGLATVWALIHIANGLVHLVTSLATGRMMPGTWTAPLLLLVAPWLLIESLRWRRRETAGSLIPSLVALSLAALPVSAQGQQPLPYAPVGLFIGSIEEGARIFTPTRLLPFGHPEAGTHQFPTVLQLHGSEFPMLVWLGERVGYRLWPTLERYPTQPESDWPYPDFRQPPDPTTLRAARTIRRARSEAPLPGLRTLLFDGHELVAFIVDTRGLSLADRGMTRATSMGLDVTRAELLARLQRAAPAEGALGISVVLFDP